MTNLSNDAAPRRFRIAAFGTVLSCAASVFFFWLFYERYLKWDFNELGRYYDAENQIVYTDAGFAWIVPAAGFLLATVVLFLLALRRRNK